VAMTATGPGRLPFNQITVALMGVKDYNAALVSGLEISIGAACFCAMTGWDVFV
jgi:hypothetical protein